YPSRPGIASQLGVLDGLERIGTSHAVDAAPFIKTRSRGEQRSGTRVSAGADVRVGISSNFCLNATVLPDFGQVEADPSVVNLSSVETFYPEQRPFFLEGASAYAVGFNCNAVNCANEELFYSRRIGRAPQLASIYGSGTPTDAVPIITAMKLTGRASDGTTVGALVSATDRAATPDGRTLEPATLYGVGRIQRDFRNGESGVSGVLTVVDRSLDMRSSAYLPRV